MGASYAAVEGSQAESRGVSRDGLRKTAARAMPRPLRLRRLLEFVARSEANR